ncbi:MAG: gliding motility-associated C-terminal domain-containing protein [Ferruginibacter sp.]
MIPSSNLQIIGVALLIAVKMSFRMRITRNTLLFTFLVMVGIGMQQTILAQCTTPINTFPYDEGFESNTNGNWVSIPVAAWQCGTPAYPKPVLSQPGAGTKSWIVGGLTTSSYASGNSELRSPCFDFSTLINPRISFLAFWETERKFDGCTFQYSLDGANTWTTLGTINSNSSCDGINWFTYDPINYLNGEPGWSGNVQIVGGGDGTCLYGLGSGKWVTAQHNMLMLAGQSSVVFRFYFGAGNQCNDFDGFGVDNIHIGETPPPGIADFTHSCNGSVHQFTNNSTACSVLWDFGDPLSFSPTSTDLNPTHSYNIKGRVYTVTLTAYFASGASDTKTMQINEPGYEPHVVNLNKCFGDMDNSFELINLGEASNEYIYSWNSNPVQNTVVANNLPGGTFTVTVTTPSGCPSSASFGFDDPPVLVVSGTPSPAKCAVDNGSITATVTGGEAPYVYSWSTNPFYDNATLNDLAPGTYAVQVTDNLGCVREADNIVVQAVTNQVNVSLGNVDFICPGQTLILDAGSFAKYKWQDNSTSQTFKVTTAGIYSVQVTDKDGCTGSASITISGDCKFVYFPSAFSPGNDALNPTFGAIGDINALEYYSLAVYNRFGQIIFRSTDPFKKWDGTLNGYPVNMSSYVWIAKYKLRGQENVFKKGTVLVLR